MNLLRINKINFKKLRFYPGKSAFLIVPISTLVLVSVVLSSQTSNLLAAAEQAIFGSAELQNQYITLQKDTGFSAPGRGGAMVRSFSIGGNTEDTNYTQADVDKVSGMDNVSNAQIISQLPISNLKVSNLFTDKSFSLGSLSGLSAELAAQFTDQDFSYTEGDAIPIVINASAFNEIYHDWQGKTEVTLDFRGMRPEQNEDGTPKVPDALPIKNRAIEYDKQDLIGQEFEMQVGGLDEIQNYTTEPTEAGIKYAQLTAEELAAKETARKDAISPYWDYEKIKTPLTYKFKIVGVIEDDNSVSSYIPTEFAEQLMQEYIQNQIDARTSAALSADILNSQFQGMTYDGVELKSGGFFAFGGGGRAVMISRPGGPGASFSASDGDDAEQYSIPGLVVSAERNEDNDSPFIQAEATGELKDADVYSKAAKIGGTMLVKLDDPKNRAAVVKALNNAGYAYQDMSKSDVYDELANNLRGITVVFTIAFVTISIAVVMFTMSKFVSESKKEIGVYRALGATKGLILRMFLFQAVLYGFIAYIFGLVTGYILNWVVSSPVYQWFSNFIDRTMGETLSVINRVDAAVFRQTDWQAIAMFSALLAVILVLIALIPARQAANLSPVQAIKGE
ncbi:MAG: FtsX-like permease family protein [Candidatus Doudnabacteria bacterium]|nr:FtsX-like permease family protein [Candidatus Doudnabacteria bacterium]